jgi:hypothetical protein
MHPVCLGCVHLDIPGEESRKKVAVPLAAVLDVRVPFVKDALGDLYSKAIDPCQLANTIADAVRSSGVADAVGVVSAFTRDIASSPRLPTLLRFPVGWLWDFLNEIIDLVTWIDLPEDLPEEQAAAEAEAVLSVIGPMLAALPADIVFRGACTWTTCDEHSFVWAGKVSCDEYPDFVEDARIAMEYASMLPFSTAGLDLAECASIVDHVVIGEGDPVIMQFFEGCAEEVLDLTRRNVRWQAHMAAFVAYARDCGRRVYDVCAL